MQIDTTTIQINPTLMQIDTTTIQIDPTSMQIDTTTIQIDPTSMQIDTTTIQIDTTTMQIGRVPDFLSKGLLLLISYLRRVDLYCANSIYSYRNNILEPGEEMFSGKFLLQPLSGSVFQ
jgi:hypothetical protein